MLMKCTVTILSTTRLDQIKKGDTDILRHFFSLQDPSIKVPERSLFPNWKVRPILKWLNYICPLIWLLGIAFSIDEMTMQFQGKHVDK